MNNKNSSSKGLAAGLGIGALIGAAVTAGVAYFLSNTEEEKEDVSSTIMTHAPPPLPPANNIPKDVEEKLICPISLEVMTDPVVTPYGHTFERKTIEEYIDRNGICPITRKPLTKQALIPNYSIREMLEHFHETKDKDEKAK